MERKAYWKDIKKVFGKKGLLYVLLSISQSFFSILMMFVFADFIDYLLDEQDNSIENILVRLLTIIMVMGLSKIVEEFAGVTKNSIELACTVYYKEKISTKISRVPYAYLEDTEILDVIKRTKEEVGERTNGLISNVLSFGGYIIRIGSIVVLVGYHLWWVGILILFILAVLIVLSFKSGEEEYEAFSEAEAYRRKAETMSVILHGREYAMERRLYNYIDYIQKCFGDAYEMGRKKEFSAQVKSFRKSGLMSLLTILFSFACVFVLIVPVIEQTMSVGIYVSLATNILSLIEQMSWELSMLMIDFTKNKLYIKDLYELFGLQEEPAESGGEDIEDIKTIEFRNVSFCYPSSEENILQNLCFTLEAGKSYALVGVNGAGKSTIIKLLAGLYCGYEGEILLNGKELQRYSKEARSKLFHFVFQNFNHYQISIREFLSIGNSDNLTEEEMLGALKKVGMYEEIERLPNRWDTLMGKIYKEGIDLSGGQWQKLVIARNILSNVQMLVLDEPTSALDPIREREVYEEYRKLSADNHSIMFMVSHRLGCIQWADEILVLGEGRILEYGTHKQLMENNGIYCEMYERQKEWYHAV